MKRRAFTLVELLVVISIISVLSLVATAVARSVLAKTRAAACLNQLRELGLGLQGYLDDHDQTLPVLASGRASKTDDVQVLETVLLPYMRNPQAFKCPQDSKQFEKSGGSYLWNSTQNGLLVSKLAFFGIQGQPERIPLITDKEAWHPGGTNFLYADQSASNKVRFAAGN